MKHKHLDTINGAQGKESKRLTHCAVSFSLLSSPIVHLGFCRKLEFERPNQQKCIVQDISAPSLPQKRIKKKKSISEQLARTACGRTPVWLQAWALLEPSELNFGFSITTRLQFLLSPLVYSQDLLLGLMTRD